MFSFPRGRKKGGGERKGRRRREKKRYSEKNVWRKKRDKSPEYGSEKKGRKHNQKKTAHMLCLWPKGPCKKTMALGKHNENELRDQEEK